MHACMTACSGNRDEFRISMWISPLSSKSDAGNLSLRLLSLFFNGKILTMNILRNGYDLERIFSVGEMHFDFCEIME